MSYFVNPVKESRFTMTPSDLDLFTLMAEGNTEAVASLVTFHMTGRKEKSAACSIAAAWLLDKEVPVRA